MFFIDCCCCGYLLAAFVYEYLFQETYCLPHKKKKKKKKTNQVEMDSIEFLSWNVTLSNLFVVILCQVNIVSNLILIAKNSWKKRGHINT